MTAPNAFTLAKRATQAFKRGDAFFNQRHPKTDKARDAYFEAFRLREEIESLGYAVKTAKDGTVSVLAPLTTGAAS